MKKKILKVLIILFTILISSNNMTNTDVKASSNNKINNSNQLVNIDHILYAAADTTPPTAPELIIQDNQFEIVGSPNETDNTYYYSTVDFLTNEESAYQEFIDVIDLTSTEYAYIKDAGEIKIKAVDSANNESTVISYYTARLNDLEKAIVNFSNGDNFIIFLKGETVQEQIFTQTESGHLLYGWYDNPDFTGEALYTNDISDITLTQPVSLYANVDFIKCNISFDISAFSNIDISDIVDSYIPDVLPSPKVDGYKFIGWYYDIDYNNQVTQGELITIDTTLYGKFELLPIYTITLDMSSVGENPIIFEDNQIPSYLLTPDVRNYYFVGWYYDADYTNPVILEELITKDTTLYAKFEELPDYVVTLDSSAYGEYPGTKEELPIIVSKYMPTSLPTLFQEGYIFDCWCYDKDRTTPLQLEGFGDGDGDAYILLDEDITLYAKWKVTHVHEYEVERFDYGDVIVEVYTCIHEGCSDTITVEIRVEEKVLTSINELENDLTSEKLNEVKNTIVEQISNNIRECDGKEIIKVIDSASAAIDQLELDSSISTTLLDVYADALFEVRLEKNKMQVITTIAKNINDLIGTNTYNEKTIYNFKKEFARIEDEVSQITDVLDVQTYLNNWNSYVSAFKRNLIYNDNLSIYSYEGYNLAYTLNFEENIANDSVLDDILNKNKLDKNTKLLYIINLTKYGEIINNELDETIKITIDTDVDLSKRWKAKVKLSDDSQINAKINGSKITFNTNVIGDIEIIFIEPFPIFPLYIISGLTIVLIAGYIFIEIKEGGKVNE